MITEIQTCHFYLFLCLLILQNVPGDVGIMLVFAGLTDQQAGIYSCHANYANTEQLSASVEVNTFGKIAIFVLESLNYFKHAFNNQLY